MSVLPIHRFPDNLQLRQKAQKVEVLNGLVQQFIDDLLETLQRARGVSLAAPQVGILLQIIVIRLPQEQPLVFINPEIIERTGVQRVNEGCLSVPGFYAEIQRADDITLIGLDRQGKSLRFKAAGLLAQTVQHAVDHLHGRLYIDYVQSAASLHRIEYPVAQGVLRN